MYILGVDTGGTKTKSIVLNENSELLGTGLSGPGNYHVAGTETARKNVEEAIQQALSEGNIDRTETIIGGFSMGTLDTEEDHRIISDFLDEIEYVDERYIENDVITAYYAVTAGEPGITVVAGTGAMAYGVNEEGVDCRSSGWGWLIGDEGSGFYAARRGLQEATRAYDGRGESTVLVDAACEHFELAEFENIFSKVYEGLDHPKNIASFAESIVRAARNGDEVAQQVVAEAAEELANATLAVQQDLNIDPPVHVGCVGSFGTADIVSTQFKANVRTKIPDVEFLESVNHPVVGSVVIVSEVLDRTIDRETLQGLDETIERMEGI